MNFAPKINSFNSGWKSSTLGQNPLTSMNKFSQGLSGGSLFQRGGLGSIEASSPFKNNFATGLQQNIDKNKLELNVRQDKKQQLEDLSSQYLTGKMDIDKYKNSLSSIQNDPFDALSSADDEIILKAINSING